MEEVYTDKKLSELENIRCECASKMNALAKEYHELKSFIGELDVIISNKKEDIVNIKIGDLIKIESYRGALGVYAFNGDVTIEITGITNKFINGRVTEGSLYKKIKGDYTFMDNKHFKVNKKTFFSVIHNYSDLGKLINRDTIIGDLF